MRHAATADTGAYVQKEAAVEVYALPQLSAEDRAAVKEAGKLAPVDTGAPIDVALARSLGAAGSEAANPATTAGDSRGTCRRGTAQAATANAPGARCGAAGDDCECGSV